MLSCFNLLWVSLLCFSRDFLLNRSTTPLVSPLISRVHWASGPLATSSAANHLGSLEPPVTFSSSLKDSVGSLHLLQQRRYQLRLGELFSRKPQHSVLIPLPPPTHCTLQRTYPTRPLCCGNLTSASILWHWLGPWPPAQQSGSFHQFMVISCTESPPCARGGKQKKVAFSARSVLL